MMLQNVNHLFFKRRVFFFFNTDLIKYTKNSRWYLHLCYLSVRKQFHFSMWALPPQMVNVQFLQYDTPGPIKINHVN